MAKEYIDREAVYEELLDFYRSVTSRFGEDDHYARGIAEGMDAVSDAPAADVAPVVHGRWHRCGTNYGTFRCSNCGNVEQFLLSAYRNIGERMEYQGHNVSRYCPNCGAKMDGGAEDG